MKVQNINLAFGKRSKQNAGENGPNVFAITTLGAATGAVAGHLSKKYLPVSDEFFFGVSNKNSIEAQSVKSLVNQFVQDYSLTEIQDARVLKTALSSVGAQVTAIVPELKNKGISDLINEPAIKIVDKNDSEELNNSFKVLQADISKDLEIKDKKELLHNFENISDMASNLLSKAKHGLVVKENLEKYKQNLKGFSENGLETIKSTKFKIQNNIEFPKDIQRGVFQSFKEMVQTAKVSQRSSDIWVALPSVVLGLASMTWAINTKMSKENKKGTLS